MLQQFLEKNKDTILAEWIDQTINTYEPEMVRFLHKQKNQFANPVRNTILTCSEKIYDALLNQVDINEDFPGLEDFIKLRAVQDFSPSQALFFIFSLREIVSNSILDNLSGSEIIDFERKMDNLTKVAFDLFSKSRNKIYEIRLAEIKSQTRRAFNHIHNQ